MAQVEAWRPRTHCFVQYVWAGLQRISARCWHMFPHRQGRWEGGNRMKIVHPNARCRPRHGDTSCDWQYYATGSCAHSALRNHFEIEPDLSSQRTNKGLARDALLPSSVWPVLYELGSRIGPFFETRTNAMLQNLWFHWERAKKSYCFSICAGSWDSISK